MERPGAVDGAGGELVEDHHARPGGRELPAPVKEPIALDVLRRLLEENRVVVPRRLERFERNGSGRQTFSEARPGHRDLVLVRRDPFGLVTQGRQARERPAGSHPDIQEPRRRRRKPLKQKRGRPPLGIAHRFASSLEEAIVERLHFSLFREDMEEHVQWKRKFAVGRCRPHQAGGYLTLSRNKPEGGAVQPAGALDRFARRSATPAGARWPRPTSTRVPTTRRTIFQRKCEARTR